jgi:SNF2 family DNA or RNA helicase
MGQSKPVVVHRIIALNTIDELVDKAVANKEFTQQELRKALASLTKQSSIHNEDL